MNVQQVPQRVVYEEFLAKYYENPESFISRVQESKEMYD